VAIPVRILRVTQFHEFVPQIVEWGRQDDVIYVPKVRTRPVAARSVAEPSPGLANGSGRVPGSDGAPIAEIGGPREQRLVVGETARRPVRRPDTDRGGKQPGRPDHELVENGGLLPGPDATLAGPTFEEWLNAQVADPSLTIPRIGDVMAREDAQIRESMDASGQALRAKDINALMEHYAPEIVTFDVRPPLQIEGVDAYRKNFEAWFASVQGPIDYEISNLRITMSDDVAFSHYLVHVKSTKTTGEKADYWVRVTSGFQKMNGQWMVTHEHVSLPFEGDG